ncbi:polysialyltransferase family glycosyltransferase [Idiomarina abyssalis]|uniref:polysialyltransferase family glycosyltransferase n=1 Tax=Idiomarina abyssalis TaxID=86102 RepID=UPI003A911B01
MIDNLFVVESPLQALVAVELSLQLKNEKNGIVYRLVNDRDRNNQQIEKVVNKGKWCLIRQISFASGNSLVNHLSIRKELKILEKEFSKNVKQLFIGEFRSQWMHFMRAAARPKITILIDDGAATLISKSKYIDKGVYFPENLWRAKGFLKSFIKRNIYRDFLKCPDLQEPIFFASAFLKSESIYPVDFTELKKLFKSKNDIENNAVYFFGSKYSEAQIISIKYEMDFIRRVKDFYSRKNLKLIYCAHRDESIKKLNFIRSELGLEVVTPELPAEVFLLEQGESVVEVAGAYSSVLNNVKVIFPKVAVRAFYLKPDEVNIKNRDDIINVYQHYEAEGIYVELESNGE